MFDHARLVRLVTAALASCAVTWALAVGAFAMPAIDVPAEGGATPAPAFKAAPGDIDKVPSAATAPAYQPSVGDHLKTPDPAQVARVLNTVGGHEGRQATSVPGGDDDHGALALAVAVLALLAAVGAGTVLVTRARRPMLGA
jgi:hypothetical protein